MEKAAQCGPWKGLAAMAVMAILAGCSGGGSSPAATTDSGGGGGGGTTVTGLTVASKVSVVDAQQQTGSGKLMAALRKLAALSTVPADSDYNKDVTNVYVNEKAGDAFKTVNQILCMVDQTKYGDMVNKGFYRAMVNTGVCEGNDSAANSGASTQGGTSASGAVSYDTWTVKSERTDSNSPQTLTAYIHLSNGGPSDQPMTVQAKMTITEGKSDTNPLGIFTMNFKGAMDSAPSVTAMKGVLKTERDSSTGKVVIKFSEQEYGQGGSVAHEAKAAYVKDDTAKTGQGSAYKYEKNNVPQTDTVNFAYNASFFKRVDPTLNPPSGPCLNRTQFETSAWRYGMYSTSGSRKNVNAGFSINTKQDGTGYYGYLGYYGLNLPPDAPALADGASVFKQTWSNGNAATTAYQLYVRPGKLKKHTRSVVSLKDIKNIPLEGNIPTVGSTSPGNTMYRLSWGDDGKFAIRATATQNMNGPPAWQDEASPVPIETYTLPFNNLSLYSQALGGQVNVQLSCTQVQLNNPGAGFTCSAPTGETQVVFYKEDVVYPTDTVPATLSCYDNCPKAGASGMDGTNPMMMTYQMSFDPTVSNRHDYTIADMILKDHGNSVVFDPSKPSSQSWGFGSGALFDPSTSNMTLLQCDWDHNQTCGWKAWSVLPVFYTWETGSNTWNQFTGVKDSNGNFVPFDPPMQVIFTYPASGTGGLNPSTTDAKYSGTKFYLQYSGFGDLQGIPGKCVNPDNPSQSVSDCSQPGLRWVPEFTIPADTTVTAGSVSYLVKPLDVEQRMAMSPGSCTNLGVVDMSSSWPNLATDWTDPQLTTEPTAAETGPPKVIGGVIQ